MTRPGHAILPPRVARDLGRKVSFLSRPAAYPDDPARVEALETHMSWVFLTDRHAWKLKKPVRYLHLNYRTPANRRFYCREEVRLNRRLAPSVYQAVVALTEDATGSLALGGGGSVVDWLVRMRRLPSARMLDTVLAQRAVSTDDVQSIAAVLARFYRRLPPVVMAAGDYVARFERQAAEAVAVLAAAPQCPPAVRPLADRLGRTPPELAVLVGGRATAGLLREGHGDLRPDHICLGDPPLIIDCLEFSRDLRLADPVDELAFLAMECGRLGGRSIGLQVMDAYGAMSGDRPPAAIVAFYTAHRALVRAMLSMRHVTEPGRHPPAYWMDRANTYVVLAEDAVAGLAV
ncbi:MAG: hypothetical protein ACTS3R_18390 [Inquilinaceae bacterium]